MALDRAGTELDRDAADEVGVFREEALDDLALVAERDDELAEAVVGVVGEDVPEERTTADLDHRLRARLGLLAEARAETSRENRRAHG
jgi:hypothetical protein